MSYDVEEAQAVRVRADGPEGRRVFTGHRRRPRGQTAQEGLREGLHRSRSIPHARPRREPVHVLDARHVQREQEAGVRLLPMSVRVVLLQCVSERAIVGLRASHSKRRLSNPLSYTPIMWTFILEHVLRCNNQWMNEDIYGSNRC